MSDETEGFVPGKWLKMRMMLAAGLLSVLLVLIAYRAWVLQVREAEKLRAMAEDQYLQDVELPARRGRILDRNGVELAASAEVDSVHVNAEFSDQASDHDPQIARLVVRGTNNAK